MLYEMGNGKQQFIEECLWAFLAPLCILDFQTTGEDLQLVCSSLLTANSFLLISVSLSHSLRIESMAA